MTGRIYYKAELMAVKCKNMKLTFVDLQVSTGEFFGYQQPQVFIRSSLQVLFYSITHVWYN
jgi:hypothetical protein